MTSRRAKASSWRVKAGGPFTGPLDLPEVAAGRFAPRRPVRVGGGGEFLGGEDHVVENDREEVVEVVCDPAGELAQVLQALGLLQLCLRLVPLRLQECATRP